MPPRVEMSYKFGDTELRVSVCLEWWWYEIMILLCGLLVNPKATVASMGILIQITSIIYIFPSSLGFSVSTRVGNELGASNPSRAKLSAVVGLCFSFVLSFSALFFAFMVRKSWATMFTDDREIIALTSLVLPIIGLCELGNCPQTTGCGVLRGTAQPKVGANINLGCFYLVGMPVAIGLGFYAGLDFEGLWMGLLAAQSSLCGDHAGGIGPDRLGVSGEGERRSSQEATVEAMATREKK
ncbi:MATE efflux family protein [Actinidia rufa]|uniref:MATE efflux family protein n=1 Tax=Actinidia rufa TaxID=165716 RepID=A0A7J0GWY3_9ERIC|nr:MATE efflux family protein [Actinidia rufa]